MRLTRLVSVLLILLTIMTIIPTWLPTAQALPPLETVTFPAGTFVIPMDEKQSERILVFGFIHALLRDPTPIQIFRAIEPPNVTLSWNLTASPKAFIGGPFLVLQRDASKVSLVKNNPDFKRVTVGALTAQVTLNNIFRVTDPTKILVIQSKPSWGRTDITLDAMKIPYDLTNTTYAETNPDLIFQYSLVVFDCFAWAGKVPATLASNVRSHVDAGNEVIFTDIAMKDLNATFPGYVTLWGPQPGSRTANAYAYNPPRKYDPSKYGQGADRFDPSEFPSQYYNAQPRSNEVKVFTESAGYVVSSIASGKVNDVRILADSKNYGPAGNQYAILAFYFEYGNGIVEGLAFHPQQQVKNLPDNGHGYYAVHQWYGNKFVHGPPRREFQLSATPPVRVIPAGEQTTYDVTVKSFAAFSSPVTLGFSPGQGCPPAATCTFNPPAPTPPAGGTAGSVLTVATTRSTPEGSYPLNITGQASLDGDAVVRWVLVTLNVTTPEEDFEISVSPNLLTINLTECKPATVSVGSIGAFNQNVTLNITAAPGGVYPSDVTFTFTPPAPKPDPGIPGGSPAFSVMRVCVGPYAHNGTYPMTITGTSHSSTGEPLSHSVSFTLVIPPPPPSPPINWIWLLLLMLLPLLLIPVLYFATRPRKPPTPIVYAPARAAVPARPQRMYVVPRAAQRFRRAAVAAPVVAAPVVTAPIPSRAVALPAKRAIWGFILAMISGILILLNAAALLSPGFWGAPTNWSSIFFWLGGPSGIGQSIAVLIGLITGFTVIAGGIMMLMRRGVFGAALVLPFAVMSFIIGGGFIAGMVLGIVAGILGALGR